MSDVLHTLRNMTNMHRLGPMERAIRTKNTELLLETVKGRCEIDPADPDSCWLWSGSMRTNGYGYCGRHTTNRLVHRVVAWASNGFAGAYNEMPPIHHMCAVKRCCRPEHLVPVTVVANVAESLSRAAHIKRIAELTQALDELDPKHKLLANPWWGEDVRFELKGRRGQGESSRWLALRAAEKAENSAARKAHEALRYRQVLAVDRLKRRGMTTKDALIKVGIARSVYDDWRKRLQLAY